jgi:hypothetical protein
MKWFLVVILLMNGKLHTDIRGFESNYDCRVQLERLVVRLKDRDAKYLVACSEYLDYNMELNND